MGRHADPAARRRLPAVPVLIAAAVAGTLLAGGATWWVVGSGEGCDDRRTVALTVAPELGDLTERLFPDPLPLDDGGCAVAAVTAQEPLQTVGNLGALDAAAVPDVWVPDSSLWAARAGGATLEDAGAMASSPVVLATSRATAAALGWSGLAPTWAAALATGRPLAVPDLGASAEDISALAAVRTSLGGGAAGDTAVVQAVLAAARSAGPAPGEALQTASSGSVDAALVPVSEQQVLSVNAGVADPALVAVYPSEGSPSLDYPVLRVGSSSGRDGVAVDAVVRALTSERARAAVLEAGFRTPDGTAPPGAGPDTGTVEAVPTTLRLDPAEVQGLLTRLSSLAAPSRILAVFDISTSMEAEVGTRTRATLARDAAKSALTLFPDSSAIGLWGFANRLNGDADWAELVPTRGLAADAGGRTQRDVLREQLDSIPDRLTPGGTGLYDTSLAAVRAARADYDPTAVSSVVVVTDGKDEDGDSIGLGPLLETLRAEVDPGRPVKVIGIALGPDADLGSLQEIAAATGGAAYSAVDENDLQSVLFDALRQRG